MKKIITLLSGLLILFSVGLRAQTASSLGTYTIQYDTVNATPPIGVSTTVEDGISASSTVDTVVIDWKVIASDFPSDWVPAYSICDNNTCILGSGLWTPSSGTLSTHTSMPYAVGSIHAPGGDFHMLMDFSSTNFTGCHYMTVRLNSRALPADTAYETFVICNTTTGISNVPKSSDDVLLYPNPAHDEVNLVYSAASDIKSIAVYNIIGRVLAVYKVTDNTSANLNLENIPSGIYFIRLMNSQGNVVITRKFTKQ